MRHADNAQETESEYLHFLLIAISAVQHKRRKNPQMTMMMEKKMERIKDDLSRYYAIARPLQYHMVITGVHSPLLFIAKVMTPIIILMITIINQGVA